MQLKITFEAQKIRTSFNNRQIKPVFYDSFVCLLLWYNYDYSRVELRFISGVVIIYKVKRSPQFIIQKLACNSQCRILRGTSYTKLRRRIAIGNN